MTAYEYLPELAGAPHRLGRHVHHDPASARFAHPVAPKAALRSVFWPLAIGTLDQGDLGSCVANTGVERLASTDAAGPGVGHVTLTAEAVARQPYRAFTAGEWPLNQDFAQRLYAVCTRADDVSGSWPPSDTGSTGLGLAKALVLLGLATPTYTHAFTFQALQTAMLDGPVPVGVAWYESMFTVAPDGHLTVDPRSGVAGGHEVLLSAMDLERDRYWLRNHWGSGWGAPGPDGTGGWAWLTGAELAALLRAQGDVTVVTPARAPAPPPAPAPAPTPRPADDADAVYANAAQAHAAALASWARARGLALDPLDSTYRKVA